MARAASRLAAFDTLRGLAALTVMAHHLRLPFIAGEGTIWFGQGFLAVDLFFLLSGYVMARTYEPALLGGIGTLTFLRARLERLYPMLLLGSLLGVALFPFYKVEGLVTPASFDWPLALAGQFLLIPFLAGNSAFIFNNVQWSIVYELIANALHAAGIKGLTIRALAAIAAVSLVLLVTIAVFGGSFSLGWSRNSFGLGFARIGFAYALGIILHRTADAWQARLPTVATWQLGLATVTLLALPELPSGHPLLGVLQLATLMVLVGIVMLASKTAANRHGAEWLGAMSYPLYALHTPLLALLHWLLLQSGLGAAGLLNLLGLLVGCAAIAWLAELTGRRIEQPLIAWRRGGAAQIAIGAARVRTRASAGAADLP